MDTEALKKLAQAATKGPWEHDSGELRVSGGFLTAAAVCVMDAELLLEQRIANADFIAAANPAAILSLIDSHDQLVAALTKIASADSGEEGCYYTNRENIRTAKGSLAAAGAA